MKPNKTCRLRPKFVKACAYWIPTRVSRHIQTDKALLTWSRAKLIAWFESGMKISPTQHETNFLNEKLDVALNFVTSLERGLIHDAVKIAREEWNRDLSKDEIAYLLKCYQGTMTVVLSENDGVSIKLES